MKDGVKCTACGWEGSSDELLGRTVYEDFGDVYYAVCPNCKRTDIDNEMIVEIVDNENADGTERYWKSNE